MKDLPITKYYGDDFTEECMFCGTPIMFGDQVVYDSILDSWYCNNECRNTHLEMEPQLMKLLEEDPNG